MSEAEFFDREYNARAAVANAPEIMAGWRTRSEQSQKRLAGLQNLRYGESPGETLDLFWCLKPDRPLFVFIHGGYWRALHKDDFAWMADPFVAAGVNVAVVNYDLVPQIDLETQVLQVLRSLVWLFDHGEELDFDPAKIYVGGHSAGGHLTAMMMCADWPAHRADLPANLVKGAVAVSGLYDLEPISKAPFLNVDLKLTPERVRVLSPVKMPPLGKPELLLTVGGLESSEFQRQADVLEKAWGASIKMQRLQAEGCHHFSVCEALADSSHPLFKAALALISQDDRR